MALSCIPVPRLVSCTFSTIPICPFLIQRFFHLLVSTLFLLASSKLHVATCFFKDYNISATLSAALPTCPIKYTSKKGLELMRLLTVELCSIKMCVAGSTYIGVSCAT